MKTEGDKQTKAPRNKTARPRKAKGEPKPTAQEQPAKPQEPQYGFLSVNLIMPANTAQGAFRSWLDSLPNGVEAVVVINKPSGGFDEIERVVKEETNEANGITVKLIQWEYPGQDANDFHFGNARNVALKHSTRDWVLWLDIDDRINPHDFTLFNELPQLAGGFGGVICGTYGFQMPMTEGDEGEFYAAPHLRIFRRSINARWRFGIHEQIIDSINEQGYKVAHLPLHIEHLGYQCSRHEFVAKLERNVNLLMRELKGNVANPTYRTLLRYLAGNTKQLLELNKEP